MKHKIKANDIVHFLEIWKPFVARLEEAGEKIVGARFVFDDTCGPFNGCRATVWTNRAKKEGGKE